MLDLASADFALFTQSSKALFQNALFGNALFGNALFGNALFGNALFTNGLIANVWALIMVVLQFVLIGDDE